ncbi:MAG TPA: serine/threonine-protein kinase [Kofleriaceae bacterium]|nr:serine/threonine-protein kinase [Kofleriaceae bacterium]
MECPGEIQLLGWMRGALDAGTQGSIDEHVDVCGDCVALIAALGRVAPASADDRYVIGHEIARGGMGRVFAATDRLLGRPVAVKTVRGAAGAARFAREMRITARLQHPAIVAVYDAGAFPDGEPFYVMRHVDGRSLDRAAAEATTLAARLALLPSVMTAIDAVAYAHDCGVIHRDLKPANVLVGAFGETVVLDWGLAKQVSEPDDAPSANAAPTTDGDDRTRTGTVLGTPAYMAPEQARGHAGPRSDVYGLGAILFHVLTGAPPPAELVPIATREPAIAPELAAIVDRAIAREPDARYADAHSLADDLRRYLAGRLVEAHHYTTGELVRRWARRHRAALVAAAVAFVAIVGVGAVALQQVLASRDAAEDARTRAEASRDTATTQRGAAEALIAFTLDDLRVRLEALGRLDVLVGISTAIDAYYAAIPASTDAQLLRHADALAVLGDARRDLGDLAGADAAYEREEQRAKIALAHHHDAASARAVCLAKLRRGDLAKRRGQLAAARSSYGACPAQPGADAEVQVLIAVADLDRLEGHFDAADAALARAEPLVAQVPPPRGAELAFAISDMLGIVATDRGDLDRARSAFAANIARAEQAAADSGDGDAQYRLAQAWIQRGRADRRAGELPAALDAFTRAHTAAQALVERDPENLLWLDTLGTTDDQLGTVALQRGDLDTAVARLASSLAISERLVRRAPVNDAWARGLAVSALQLGDLQRARKQPAEARASLTRAVEIATRLATAKPADAQAQRDLATMLLHLGDLERELAIPTAQATLVRSVDTYRAILQRSDTPRARIDLVGALLALSDAQPRDVRRATVVDAAAIVAPLRSAKGIDAEAMQAIADVDEVARLLAR